MIGEPGFSGGNEVGERPAGLAAFLVRLLAEKVKSLEHGLALVVRVQLDIVAHGAGGKQAIYPARCDEFLFYDEIQKSVAFAEDLACLRAMLRMFKNPRVDSFQSPGVEKRAPVNEFAQRRQRKVVKHAHTGE